MTTPQHRTPRRAEFNFMRQSTIDVPDHLAIIMDGNGRWAEERGWPRTVGHTTGARVMRDIVTRCAQLGVPQLTLYAFSSDNWKRPRAEVSALLALFTQHCRSEARALVQAGVRLTVIGRRDRLPSTLRRAIERTEHLTVDGTRMHLRVAIDYSSREAICRAHMAADATVDIPSHTTLLPPVDLMIRTGGERRLSDFLLWECAYAELIFLDVLWPAMTPALLDDALDEFAARDRRFGSISQQVSA
jgi:undecaprenyl diphosphate synthase